MPSAINKQELSEFVRTHLAHRLTAMVAPFCIPPSFWKGRNDAYRAAKEGSYSMLRMFIEFLGVKSDKSSTPPRLVVAPGESDSIQVDAFGAPARKLGAADFGVADGDFIAQIHRVLCKISAHFTYDRSKPDPYDRIASPDEVADWGRAVDIVVQKLDGHFYSVVGHDIVVHQDVEQHFISHYKGRLGLQSRVRGDGLGRPQ